MRTIATKEINRRHSCYSAWSIQLCTDMTKLTDVQSYRQVRSNLLAWYSAAGIAFQGHHTNQAYYRSGIMSPEYPE